MRNAFQHKESNAKISTQVLPQIYNRVIGLCNKKQFSPFVLSFDCPYLRPPCKVCSTYFSVLLTYQFLVYMFLYIFLFSFTDYESKLIVSHINKRFSHLIKEFFHVYFWCFSSYWYLSFLSLFLLFVDFIFKSLMH